MDLKESLEKDLTNLGFSWFQIKQIKIGLEKGLDVSIYAQLDFNYSQMQEIRFGLEKGLDVSPYLNPSIDWKEMRAIRKKLWSKK